MDVQGTAASVYMMKYGAHIPLSGMPFYHDPRTFPKLKRWQLVAALVRVHQYVEEGKVLGPYPDAVQLLDIPWFSILLSLCRSQN